GPAGGASGSAKRRARRRTDAARTRSAAANSGGKIEQGNCRGVEFEREYDFGASREHHGCTGDPQDGGAGGVCDSEWVGESALRRRDFLVGAGATGFGSTLWPGRIFGQAAGDPGFHFTNVTAAAGIQFQHNSGAFGGKFLPE